MHRKCRLLSNSVSSLAAFFQANVGEYFDVNVEIGFTILMS